MDGSTQTLRTLLGQAGFASSAVMTGLRVLGWAVPLVASARSGEWDQTSVVVVGGEAVSDQLFETARFLAAPVILTTDGVDLLAWPPDGSTPIRWRLERDRAAAVSMLDPAKLLRAKIGAAQLPLFKHPVDLLSRAQALGRQLVAPMLRQALDVATDYFSSLGGRPEDVHRRAARSVVSAMTLQMYRDRMHGLADASAMEVAAALPQQHGDLLGWVRTAPQSDLQMLEAVSAELGTGVSFATLDASVLSHVYEQSLVDDALRRDLGIHHTPPWLGMRMLDDLPVEILAPWNRTAIDPSCGSGTLLVAAHERLRRLQDESEEAFPPGVHLVGVDSDAGAVQISRLVLSLHATPRRNGWQVYEGDALRSEGAVPQATIVVTNPPWGQTRDGDMSERADHFVANALARLTPGGLFGIVVPDSWISKVTSREAREALLARHEVFDIWRIEEGAFTSRSAAAVLLGRRLPEAERHYGARVIRHVPSSYFEEFGRDRHSRICALLPMGSGELLNTAPASRFLLSIDHMPLLAELAFVGEGSQPQTRDSVVYAKSADEPGAVRWLDASASLTAYTDVNIDALPIIRFPEGFRGRWGEKLIALRKVLISATRGGPTPWKLRPFLVGPGVAVTYAFRGISPNDDAEDTCHGLLALLASAFLSVATREQSPDRNIPSAWIKRLPVPISTPAWTLLAATGRRLAHASDESERRELLLECDRLVDDAYKVPEVVRRYVYEMVAGQPAPDGAIRYERKVPTGSLTSEDAAAVGGNERTAWRLGWVESVDDSDGVAVCVPTNASGEMIRPLIEDLPAWLARDGEPLEALLTPNPFGRIRYRFLKGSWRSHVDPDGADD